MTSSRLDTLARTLLDFRTVNDRAQAAAKKAKADLDAHQRAVFDTMADLGLKTTTIDLGDGYGTVQLGRRETIRSRIIDLDVALDSFEQEARTDEITKVDVRKQVLNELVRERLETGQPLPAGVDFVRSPFIQVTRRKTK